MLINLPINVIPHGDHRITRSSSRALVTSMHLRLDGRKSDACKLIDTRESVSDTIGNWEPIALSCEHEFQNEIPLKKPSRTRHKRHDWITYPRRKWLSHILTRTQRLRTRASDGRDMSLYLEWVYREWTCLTIRLCHATGRFSHGIYAPVRSLYLHSIFTRSRQRWFRLWKWDD